MIRHSERHTLDVPADSLFAVVLDIESYPAFVPGWVSARIRERGEGRLLVDQRLGLGPVNVAFTSVASYEAPERLQIRSQDGPFRILEIDWKIVADTPERCRAEFSLHAAFSTWLLERSLQPLAGLSAPNLVARFEQRARRLEFRKKGLRAVRGG